jgi:hypothetical protein
MKQVFIENNREKDNQTKVTGQKDRESDHSGSF